MIATDLGRRVMHPAAFPKHATRKVSLTVFDNCLVKFSKSYEGVKNDGDGSFSYLFIIGSSHRSMLQISRKNLMFFLPVVCYCLKMHELDGISLMILYYQIFGLATLLFLVLQNGLPTHKRSRIIVTQFADCSWISQSVTARSVFCTIRRPQAQSHSLFINHTCQRATEPQHIQMFACFLRDYK